MWQTGLCPNSSSILTTQGCTFLKQKQRIRRMTVSFGNKAVKQQIASCLWMIGMQGSMPCPQCGLMSQQWVSTICAGWPGMISTTCEKYDVPSCPVRECGTRCSWLRFHQQQSRWSISCLHSKIPYAHQKISENT